MKASTGNLVIAAIVVVLIGVVGVVISPSQSGTVVTMTGGLLVVLYRLLQQDAGTEQVKQDLEVHTEATSKTLAEIENKVNGGLTAPLKLAAVALRQVAESNPTAENHARAEAAEDILTEHLAVADAAKLKEGEK